MSRETSHELTLETAHEEPQKPNKQHSTGQKNPLLDKTQIDYGTIFQNLKEVKVLFRQIQRKDHKLSHDLSASHNRFYTNVTTQKRMLEEKHDELAIKQFSGGAVMARKIRNRFKADERQQHMAGKMKAPDDGEPLVKAMTQAELQNQVKKGVVQAMATHHAPGGLPLSARATSLGMIVVEQGRASSPASKERQLLSDEFDLLFTEQRKKVEQNNIPLFDRLHPDTKKLFVVPYKEERWNMIKQHPKRHSSQNQVEGLSYSHYSNQMKDPVKVDQVVTILGTRLKELKQTDLEALRTILPEADKNLFLQFREGIISIDQLKARVNLKMKRANYKCLDDLIDEGLDKKVKENAEETALYIKTIHHKDSVKQITTADILTRETWQANPHCLKSLFSKIPDIKARRQGDKYKGLTTQEIEEYSRQCQSLNGTPPQQAPIIERKPLLPKKVEIASTGAVRDKNLSPVVSHREGSSSINSLKDPHEEHMLHHQKEVQTLFIQKLKESLNAKQCEHNKAIRTQTGIRSYGLETAYDMRAFCAPFDLRVLDKEMQYQQQLKQQQSKPNIKSQTIEMKPLSSKREQRLNILKDDTKSHVASTKAYSSNQDIAFLRQLIEDGNTVLVSSKDKHMLYEKEIQDERLLKAAMQASPDDAQTLLLLGSFTRKVFEKRKPRPRDFIKGKSQSNRHILSGQQTPATVSSSGPSPRVGVSLFSKEGELIATTTTESDEKFQRHETIEHSDDVVCREKDEQWVSLKKLSNGHMQGDRIEEFGTDEEDETEERMPPKQENQQTIESGSHDRQSDQYNIVKPKLGSARVPQEILMQDDDYDDDQIELPLTTIKQPNMINNASSASIADRRNISLQKNGPEIEEAGGGTDPAQRVLSHSGSSKRAIPHGQLEKAVNESTYKTLINSNSQRRASNLTLSFSGKQQPSAVPQTARQSGETLVKQHFPMSKTKRPSVADRNLFRRSRHLNSQRDLSETSSHTKIGSTTIGGSSLQGHEQQSRSVKKIRFMLNHPSSHNQGVRSSFQSRYQPPQTIADRIGVSSHFMNFIEGLGIPCAEKPPKVYYESSEAQDVDGKVAKKRILSARQRNEPILVLNSDAVARSINNSPQVQPSPSQRNSKLNVSQQADLSPMTQHFLSNMGAGPFPPSTPKSKSPPNVNQVRSSPRQEKQAVANGQAMPHQYQAYVDHPATVIVRADQGDFKYERKQTVTFYKHQNNLQESNCSSPMGSPMLTHNEGVSPLPANQPKTQYRYSTKVD